MPAKLEERYIVLKIKDVLDHLPAEDIHRLRAMSRKIDRSRVNEGRKPFTCLVLETDWPEFEPALNLLKARIEGEAEQKDLWQEQLSAVAEQLKK